MANGAQHVASKFKLEADIGGIFFDDIIGISATFALNAIPQATLIVASGKDYIRDKVATIHEQRGNLKPRAPAKVTLTITNTDGQLDMMEEGTYVIFDGYLAGIGYQRSYETVSYTLHLVHWLDDLNNSSIINGNWMPGAPYDLAQNAAYYGLNSPDGGGGDGGGLTQMVPAIDPKLNIITVGNISSDLWGSVIKPILKGVANWPAPRSQGPGAKNDAALKALERMAPGGAGGTYVPLGLNMEGVGNYNIAAAVQQALGKNAVEAFAYTTFWNKIVGEYGPNFFFAVSPGVETAFPIPFFAGLNQAYKTIDTREYNASTFNATMNQIIEAVEIYYPAPSDSGFGIGGKTAAGASFYSPMGFYPPSLSQDKSGLKLIKEPPSWLTNVVPFAAMAPWTTGVTTRPPGDMAVPQWGQPAPPPGIEESEPMIGRLKNGIATKFAEHWYKTEVLFQRHGELSGKLRLDIAPGSIVKIETPQYDLASAGSDPLYASVTGVSYAINAEKSAAGTGFVLAHIRTEPENDDTTLTAAAPPLYKQPWLGGPLAKKS